MNPKRVRLPLLPLLACCWVLSAATGTADAQLPPCEYPDTDVMYFTWARSAQVSVIIDTDFPQPMRDAIVEAFRRWNWDVFLVR